ncbi:hypothetical protein P153DRAFT_363018 [Dothidotthia symphoricarpi CBS 119687]|uniref:Ino eighty subunit 1 n=1 Tax=Dothidotthia symphoricarpi CBS 119687 TaxID=1392245 RepID=A0A6A6AS05_9PLEO|nr:uncharacterized protein P153DRAFT_363018 [Dothidotthia symphoricarpi CBS 119687]KAF2133993.1 hypothetical protein P153DRAFT_363018 [Dothidotthia symphoricarpi CBS 119687]
MDTPTPMPRADEPDSRNSLRHILAAEPAVDERPPMDEQRASPAADERKASPALDEAKASPESETTSKAGGDGGDGEARPYYTATTTTTRRNANGSVSSVYSGNKIKHLKKDDGIPLWRRDIQYDFLKLVFEDDRRVFTKQSDATPGHTFADIYLDAMAKSSKCSKILKDKLLTERPAAINMAMVCLLVNVGRMNTTLNFFPEMRAQLRTYHSIPSLQAHQDPNAYKQLQDAPRLKSILKGATEDTEQPSTVEEIMAASIPRTNPVNLIFVLSQYAPKISELHFFPPRDFFDLVMRSNLSSKSRATAFLWLMWWYLESDFSNGAAERNPFGPGQVGPADDPATAETPIKCPPFAILTPEMETLENVDTPDEKVFGEIKRKERIAILASDMAPVVTGPKRTNKKAFNQNPVFSVLTDDGASTPARDRQSPSHGSSRGRGKLAKSIIERDFPSDTDRTRSASPAGSVYNMSKKMPATSTSTATATPNMRINTLLNDDAPVSTPASKAPSRGNWTRTRAPNTGARSFKARLDANNSQDGQSPGPGPGPGPSVSAPTFTGPHGFYLPLNGSDPSHKRTRPLTQHQLAVEQYRRRRVDVILDRGIRTEYHAAAKRRRKTNAFMRAWIRCKGMADGYDTDEEAAKFDNLQQGSSSFADPDAGSTSSPPMPAGLVPLDFAGEVNDQGEESYFRAKMLGRALRRLDRWENGRRVERRRAKAVFAVDRNGVRVAGGEAGILMDGDDEDEDGDGDADGDVDGDEDMLDGEGDELERRDEGSESEDEEYERDRERGFDPHVLPPLVGMH